MSRPDFAARTWWWLAASLLVAAAAGGGTYYYVAGARPALPTDPNALRQALRDPNLPLEQRRAIMERMRTAMQVRLDARLDEYYRATQAQRTAILDRHLEEMQREMQERQARRDEGPSRDPNMPRDPNMRPTSRPGRGNFAAPTQAERKTRAESRSPDQMARRMAYMAALQARAAQRGMSLPMGPGRGGPGGGFGGGRGGRGG
jgi:hypothetical protein